MVMEIVAAVTLITPTAFDMVTGHEDHEALLTKTPLSREPGPAGIPTARASIARRAAGGLIVKLVIST